MRLALVAHDLLALLSLGHSGPRIVALLDLSLSTFIALQATGTAHLCTVLCNLRAFVPPFCVSCELLVFLFGIFAMGGQERK